MQAEFASAGAIGSSINREKVSLFWANEGVHPRPFDFWPIRTFPLLSLSLKTSSMAVPTLPKRFTELGFPYRFGSVGAAMDEVFRKA